MTPPSWHADLLAAGVPLEEGDRVLVPALRLASKLAGELDRGIYLGLERSAGDRRPQARILKDGLTHLVPLDQVALDLEHDRGRCSAVRELARRCRHAAGPMAQGTFWAPVGEEEDDDKSRGWLVASGTIGTSDGAVFFWFSHFFVSDLERLDALARALLRRRRGESSDDWSDVDDLPPEPGEEVTHPRPPDTGVLRAARGQR